MNKLQYNYLKEKTGKALLLRTIQCFILGVVLCLCERRGLGARDRDRGHLIVDNQMDMPPTWKFCLVSPCFGRIDSLTTIVQVTVC